MTLKQEQVIGQLAENGFNLAETMRKVGYAPSTCVSGTSRAHVLKYAKTYYDPDFIKREYKRVLKETKQGKKHKEQLHALDSMARTEAMFTDKTINDTNITLNEADRAILSKYGMIDLT